MLLYRCSLPGSPFLFKHRTSFKQQHWCTLLTCQVTALSQPSAEALRTEIRKTRALLRSPDLPIGVNLTVLPQLSAPDYPAIIQVKPSPSIWWGELDGPNRARMPPLPPPLSLSTTTNLCRC